MIDVDSQPKFWIGSVGEFDDFGAPINDEFIDGRTTFGPWVIISPTSWERYGGTKGKFGLGYAQRYRRQLDGRWLKVEG